MERMNRNGLLTLIAVLMALALVVRMENPAQAQITYTDWLGLTPESFVLGNRVTIDVDPVTGNTRIIQNPLPYLPVPDEALGRFTNNQLGTVFTNRGISSIPAIINANSSGAVVSNIVGGPAISNGEVIGETGEIPRIYGIQITRQQTVTGESQYFIQYGYYLASDPLTFAPLADYDELPPEVQALTWPDGTPLFPPPVAGPPAVPGSTLAISPAGTQFWLGTASPDLPLGIPQYYQGPSFPQFIFQVPIRNAAGIIVDWYPPTPLNHPPTATLPGLPTTDTVTYRGILTINQDTIRYQGEDRTLIQGMDIAIENRGTLTVNHSRIQAGIAGIWHEYARSATLAPVREGINAATYGTMIPDSIYLNNTQIGIPGREASSIEIWDPETGEIIIIDYPEMPTVIEVDALGRPIQTTTILERGDTILNGRIQVGQDVIMHRNPIGLIYQDEGRHHLTSALGDAEMQRTRYDMFNIDGPSVGIWARLFGIAVPSAGLTETGEDIYRSSRYYGSYTGSDLSSPNITRLINRIELNDNSWIFANTGISFGGDGIGIFVDRTSGIYAMDYGITDIYSLRQLYAIDWRPTPIIVYMLPSALYSGSWHEIQVDGKVIAGSPSRAGVQFSFDFTLLSNDDKNRLRYVYYNDPYDIDADEYGNVYYYNPNADNYGHPDYDPERNARVAEKFIAYNNQPDRIFWLRDGNKSIQLTHYDYATQRWMLNPDSGTPGAWLPNGQYSSAPGTFRPYFTAFDNSYGMGVAIQGTSMAWEGEVFPGPGWSPWTAYYGPTVRQITALGDDALIAGGEYYNSGAAGIYIGSLAHVSKIIIGENNDVNNLSKVLYVGSPGGNSITPTLDLVQSAKNFQAFDMMTSIKRSKLLYNPDVMFSDNPGIFHFDNTGVHGDIVSFYNAVVGYWSGSTGSWVDGVWTIEDPYGGFTTINSFWTHGHPGTIYYIEEILDVDETMNPSYVLGHRTSTSTVGATAPDIPGWSLVLDEVLLNALASWSAGSNYQDSFGYADDFRHFREALARYLYYGGPGTSLTAEELLAGYTQDGTLLIFTSGDIYSGNIYGGGFNDRYYNSGNIDVRVTNGTTIFNRNVIEWVTGANYYRDDGIRIRDLYIEKTGHLLINDAGIAVNPSIWTGSVDYAQRLIIHDVLNEGIVSGNGVFKIAERWDLFEAVNYFDGYFINRGVIAPGLPGFIGENEYQARELEKTAYDDMLSKFTDAAKSVDWDMSGVPGGQFGVFTIFGSFRLMDEHMRPRYDASNPLHVNNPLFNTDEIMPAGEYHVTVGNDTIADMLGKYAATIAGATSIRTETTLLDGTKTFIYDESKVPAGQLSKEDWQIITTEKLGTHLSWFSPSAMIDRKTGLPLLTEYEQFEYLTNDTRRAELQRQMVEMVLTPDELRQYDASPAQRAILNQRLLAENNIQFEFTQLDALLMRYGFSDVISVHGTVPTYWYNRDGWGAALRDLGTLPAASVREDLLGITQLGGIVQADRIYDLDPDASRKEKQTSFIIIASEAYTDGTVKQVTSATTDWVYANVSVMPITMPSGQSPAVLTVIDDPNYYLNRIKKAGDSYNAKSIASVLDDAMFTNPGLAQSFNFGLNSPEVLNNVFRQMANATRGNSLIMNLLTPSDHLFNRIGYGVGGMSTGRRGDIVFRNIQTGRLQQPYGQPAVPPPGHQFAPPMAGQTRGQSPFSRVGALWGAYAHSNFAMGDDKNSFKYSFYRNGVIVGSEWNLTPSAVIGGVAMFHDGALSSLSDKVRSQDYTFGLYFVTAPFEQFEVKSFLGGGFQSYKSDRYIRNGNVFIGYNPIGGTMYGVNDLFGINEHYESETTGHTFNYAIEFARPFTVNPNFVIRPTAGFEYQVIHQKGYSERLQGTARASWVNNSSNIAQGYETEGVTSGTYAMRYKSMDFGRVLMRTGVSTESYFARGGWQLRAFHIARLAGNYAPTSTQSFVSGSKEFKVRGAAMGGTAVQLGAGSHFWLNQERTATLFFDGDWNFSVWHGGYSMLNLGTGIQLSF